MQFTLLVHNMHELGPPMGVVVELVDDVELVVDVVVVGRAKITEHTAEPELRSSRKHTMASSELIGASAMELAVPLLTMIGVCSSSSSLYASRTLHATKLEAMSL